MNKLISTMALVFGSLFGTGQVLAADTFTQNGHGCAACEICTATSCSCREFNCNQYLNTVGGKTDKLSTSAKVKPEVTGTTLAKPISGAATIEADKKK
jgi:hypothetical protein